MVLMVRSDTARNVTPHVDTSACAQLQLMLWHRAKFSNFELRIWWCLRADPTLGVGGLAQLLCVHRNTAGRAVRRLLEHGFIEGELERRDPDRGTFRDASLGAAPFTVGDT